MSSKIKIVEWQWYAFLYNGTDYKFTANKAVGRAGPNQGYFEVGAELIPMKDCTVIKKIIDPFAVRRKQTNSPTIYREGVITKMEICLQEGTRGIYLIISGIGEESWVVKNFKVLSYAKISNLLRKWNISLLSELEGKLVRVQTNENKLVSWRVLPEG